MPVIIGVDSRFTNSLNGIGRDYRSIVRSLADEQSSSKDSNYEFVNIDLTGFLNRLRAYIRLAICKKQTFISASSQLDVFFSPQVSPFASKTGKNVVRIHDLFPIQYPRYFKKISVWLFQRSLQVYPPDTILLFNSWSTKDYFEKIFPTKIKTGFLLYCERAQLSELNQCNQCEGCEFLAQGQLDKRRILLAVGTLEPRKNYETLIQAYRNQEIKNEFQLIVCGNNGWRVRGLKKLLQHGEIKVLQKLCDGSLGKLYRSSNLFVSCSYDEGFDLPACEANAVGIPLVLSDIPVHRELHSNFAVYFDPKNVNDLVSKIRDFDKVEKLRLVPKIADSFDEDVHRVFNRIVHKA
jgi:glycosyltransferase involved in cell wall biosynthesis